jgi:hypothetical protein
LIARDLADTGFVLGPTERKTIRARSDPKTARRVLRSRLVPMRDGIPGAYVGRELTPGVRGWVVGRLMFLGVAAPGRNLWSNRRSPVLFGRIVHRADGGSDLRFALYRQGFPYRAFEDRAAMATFAAWLDGLEGELGAQ